MRDIKYKGAPHGGRRPFYLYSMLIPLLSWDILPEIPFASFTCFASFSYFSIISLKYDPSLLYCFRVCASMRLLIRLRSGALL